MVINTSIDLDDRGLRKFLGRYEEHIESQMHRSINVGVRKTRSEFRRQVGQKLGVRAAPVRDKIVSVNATRGDWRAAVFVSAKKFPLSVYKSFRERRGGSVYRTGGQTVVRKRAFFVRSKFDRYGRPQVFERVTRKSNPIRVAYGSSAYAYLKNKVGFKVARRYMLKNTLAELERLVKAKVV